MQLDPGLAEAANRTWQIASEIHDRQTEKGANVNGRRHVERVEDNIWRLLDETHDRSHDRNKNLGNYSEVDLYLLSCAACCHDFDKGLHNAVLDEDFKHGEGSGDFVYKNWQALSIESEAAAEYIDWIVGIHDAKEDFDQELHKIPASYTLFNKNGDLRRLSTLLQAADTLHFDESRISCLAVPDESLGGLDRVKQIARKAIHGWRPDGERIVVTASIKSADSAQACQEFARYLEGKEWPPIGRNLKAYQFPHRIEFQCTYPPSLRDQFSAEGMGLSDTFDLNLQRIMSLTPSVAFVTTDLMVSDEPLRLIAVPADGLAEYLGAAGPLSVIDNPYIEPKLTVLAASSGAINRIFVGPANSGKTRAAYEWIHDKVGLDKHAWVVIRPESGSVPQEASKFVINFEDYYGKRGRRPNKAILFADDLPEFLPPAGSSTGAAEAVHRLLEWFRLYPGLQERLFVGTIRSERMHDKPGWPDQLIELGSLQVLRVETLDAAQRRDLWKGMSTGRTFRNQVFEQLNVEIGEGFLDAVAAQEADPEAIAYYARAMAERGIARIDKSDAASFSADVARIWIDLTWPTIFNTYGPAASVFLTLARLIEAGSRSDSGFPESLSPGWEYHAVLGSALLNEIGGEAADYLPALKRMLKDGHASGVAGDWIRPRFDFLLQVPDLGDIEIPLPSAEWFAHHANDLSSERQLALARHLSSGGRPWTGDAVTAHWLVGHAFAMVSIAAHEQQDLTRWLEQALEACKELDRRFRNAESPAIRERVAWAVFYSSLLFGAMDRYDEALETHEDLRRRFGDDATPKVREFVAKGLFGMALLLRQIHREDEALETWGVLAQRFGDEEAPKVREHVTEALLQKGLLLDQMDRNDEALATWGDLAQRFEDDEAPKVREHVARALVLKGLLLEQIDRKDQAFEMYEEVDSRFGTDESYGAREQVTKALFRKGLYLRQTHRNYEAIETWVELDRRFGNDESSGVREKVADGLLCKCLLLGQLDRYDETLEALVELERRFRDDESPRVREPVASGLLYKSLLLRQMERNDQALETHEELERRFHDVESPRVRESVASGLLNKAILLEQMDRNDQALETYAELERRFGDDESPGVREPVASGLFLQGNLLGSVGRETEALHAYTELERRFRADETPSVREPVAAGLVGKGILLWKEDRNDEAIPTWMELVRLFGDDESPRVRKSIAWGLSLAGNLLGSLGRDEEAVNAYLELDRRFGADETPEIRERVVEGLVRQSELLFRMWRESKDESLLGEAISAGHRALAMGADSYNLACAFALVGETTEALEMLERSLGKGEISWRQMAKDPAWDALRDQPRYKSLEMKYGGQGTKTRSKKSGYRKHSRRPS